MYPRDRATTSLPDEDRHLGAWPPIEAALSLAAARKLPIKTPTSHTVSYSQNWSYSVLQQAMASNAWRQGLLRSTMRYGFLMRAPNRTTGDLRWVVTETNKQHAVVTEKIDVLRKFVLPGAAVVGAAAAYIYNQNSKMKASRETPMGFDFEKEAVGEVPAMTEESSPAMRGSR